MRAGLVKILFSTIFLGASVGGSSYGVVKLVKSNKLNNSSDKKAEDSSENIKPVLKENGESGGSNTHLIPEGERLVSEKSFSNNERKKHLIQEEEQSTAISLSNENTEAESNSTDFKEVRENLQNDKKESISDLQIEQKSLSENPTDFSGESFEVGSQQQEDTSLLELEKNKEKYEQERKDITLETVWIYRDSSQEKSCTLLKKDQNRKIPDIMENESESDDTCDSIETVWSGDKSLTELNQQEGLWIRGEKDAVKDLIGENWAGGVFKLAGFVSQEEEKSSSISDEFSELNTKMCSVEKKDEGNWVEISCLKSNNFQKTLKNK